MEVRLVDGFYEKILACRLVDSKAFAEVAVPTEEELASPDAVERWHRYCHDISFTARGDCILTTIGINYLQFSNPGYLYVRDSINTLKETPDMMQIFVQLLTKNGECVNINIDAQTLGNHIESCTDVEAVGGEEKLIAWLVGMPDLATSGLITVPRYAVGCISGTSLKLPQAVINDIITNDVPFNNVVYCR